MTVTTRNALGARDESDATSRKAVRAAAAQQRVMTDQQLLQDYVETGSQDAFAQLVSRHVDLVYGAALRQVRNSHLAEDVTQAVFILLAKKAAGLKREIVPAAWLLTATRYASLDALKLEGRRRKHESRAAQMAMPAHESGAAAGPTPIQTLEADEAERRWAAIKPHLDEAMNRLAENDRRAVVLKYYEKKTFREIGQALGIEEEAARKRVTRATQKLRGLLAERGSFVAEAMLPLVLKAKLASAPAPAGLAGKVTVTAMASMGGSGGAAGAGALDATADGGASGAVQPPELIAREVGRRLLLMNLKFAGAMAGIFVVTVVVLVLILNFALTRMDEHRHNQPPPPPQEVHVEVRQVTPAPTPGK
jgi:RNA polymerase sigma factor (sigma-70 family)